VIALTQAVRLNTVYSVLRTFKKESRIAAKNKGGKTRR
jgi:hypothetical protein